MSIERPRLIDGVSQIRPDLLLPVAKRVARSCVQTSMRELFPDQNALPVEREWIDFSKTAEISGENLIQLRFRIEELKKRNGREETEKTIRFTSDEDLVSKILVLRSGTRLYELREDNMTGSLWGNIIVWPIEKIGDWSEKQQKFIYLGNFGNDERARRRQTCYSILPDKSEKSIGLGTIFRIDKCTTLLVKGPIKGESEIKDN